MNFNDFALSDQIKRAISEIGYAEATDIQKKSIPLILEGKDVIGLSQTGSGKTAAYGIPALEFVDPTLNTKYPQVLVLSPTRELAMQVTDELHKFSKYSERIHIVPVYGGQPINRQITLLRNGCQIIVGTPGRIMDLMNRKVIKLAQLKMVILDEADEMLNMGFREDIELILSSTPDERQTILFSATMPKEIIDITGKYQNDPEIVKIASKQLTATGIAQSFFEVARGRKKDALSLLLQYYQPKLSLVFCNTKRMVDEVAADLKERGYTAEGLHGDMKQEQRSTVMNRFKNGSFEILVATDVAARGIDVNNIDIVFNYDLPDDCEYYVHRIGRTARAGKNGKSFTLIQGSKQFAALQEIARRTKSDISRLPMPTVEQIKNANSDKYVAKVKKFAENNDCSKCSEQLEALCENGMEYRDIAATLLQMLLDKNTLKKGTVDIPAEEIRKASPVPAKRRGNNDNRKNRGRIPNERATKKFKDVPMSCITISIGRKDNVAPKHILGAVAGESGLAGSLMGTIDIQRNETTVDVPKEYKTRIVKALNNKTIKGKRVSVK